MLHGFGVCVNNTAAPRAKSYDNVKNSGYITRIDGWANRGGTAVAAMRVAVGNSAGKVFDLGDGGLMGSSGPGDTLNLGTTVYVKELRYWYSKDPFAVDSYGNLLIGRIYIKASDGRSFSVPPSSAEVNAMYPLAEADMERFDDPDGDPVRLEMGSGKALGVYSTHTQKGLTGFGLLLLKKPKPPTIFTIDLLNFDTQYAQIPPATIIQYTVDNSASSVPIEGSCVQQDITTTKEVSYSNTLSSDTSREWSSDTTNGFNIDSENSYKGLMFEVGVNLGYNFESTVSTSGSVTTSTSSDFSNSTSKDVSVSFPSPQRLNYQ